MYRISTAVFLETERAKPTVHDRVEETDLRLVDDGVGDEAANRSLEHMLRVEPPDLVSRRNGGTGLFVR